MAKATAKKTNTKSKLAAAKKKAAAAKKTPAKKTAAKKTTAKKTPAAKKTTVPKKTASKAAPASKRKKAIGFEVMASHTNAINKEYESMQKLFDKSATQLSEFLFDGKKKSAADARATFQEIAKSCKAIRASIQEAKTKLKPIYKD